MGVTISYVLEAIDRRLRQEIAERVRRDDIETPRVLIEWLSDLRSFRRLMEQACGPNGMCKPLDLLVDLAAPAAVDDMEEKTRVVCESRSGSRIEQFGGGKTVERSNRTGFYLFPKPEDRPDA